MGQRLTFNGELNRIGEAQRKRVRTERSVVRTSVAKLADELWIGVKG